MDANMGVSFKIVAGKDSGPSSSRNSGAKHI